MLNKTKSEFLKPLIFSDRHLSLSDCIYIVQ